MSLEQNKQVALESLRVLETGDTAAAERIIAPDFINHEADDPDRSDRGIRGPAGLVATSRWLREVFSELRFDQPEAVAEDERVVVTAIMTGTHIGTVPGRAPDAQAVSAASGSSIPNARRTVRRAFGAARRSRPATSTRGVAVIDGTGMMHWLALGIALLVALGIIAIGTQYVASPRTATRSFGLPLPEEGANVAWWLRLKGVRDIVAGLGVLAFMAWGGPRGVGLILLVDAIIPVGDMLVVLGGKGSVRLAFGMHGFTAVVMILAAIPLIMGVS